MNTLVTLNNSINSDYNWNDISDTDDRIAAQATVNSYRKEWEDIREKADALMDQNNISLGRCVYGLKNILPHGEFSDVCAKVLKLNNNERAALADIGCKILNGNEPKEVLEMAKKMSARAFQQLLRQDEDTKARHISHYEKTGETPSRNAMEKSPAGDKSTKVDVPLTEDEQVLKRKGLLEQKGHILHLLNTPTLPHLDTVGKCCIYCLCQGNDSTDAIKQLIDNNTTLRNSMSEHLNQKETDDVTIEVELVKEPKRLVLDNSISKDDIRLRR